MADWWRPPPVRWADVVAAVLVFGLTCGLAWVVAGFVPGYDAVARENGNTRYLPLAYAVAWVGIVAAVIMVPLWIVRAVRLRQRAWPTALLLIPMLAGAWVLGLLVAVVAVSV
ncbi:hypothetical protein AB0N05_19000 [Nocardia sp. NPDC051030]|uniref:hypothetical protein n=1 Tax=Nocardia sp. NPDC051030 TaxID=3155162 RepID=UPI0034408241